MSSADLKTLSVLMKNLLFSYRTRTRFPFFREKNTFRNGMIRKIVQQSGIPDDMGKIPDYNIMKQKNFTLFDIF